MKSYDGLEVSQEECAICVLSEDGRILTPFWIRSVTAVPSKGSSTNPGLSQSG